MPLLAGAQRVTRPSGAGPAPIAALSWYQNRRAIGGAGVTVPGGRGKRSPQDVRPDHLRVDPRGLSDDGDLLRDLSASRLESQDVDPGGDRTAVVVGSVPGSLILPRRETPFGDGPHDAARHVVQNQSDRACLGQLERDERLLDEWIGR